MASENTPDDMTRDLAYAIFMLGSDAEDVSDARREKWVAERATYVAQARRLVRRLEKKGYAFHKAG